MRWFRERVSRAIMELVVLGCIQHESLITTLLSSREKVQFPPPL